MRVSLVGCVRCLVSRFHGGDFIICHSISTVNGHRASRSSEPVPRVVVAFCKMLDLPKYLPYVGLTIYDTHVLFIFH